MLSFQKFNNTSITIYHNFHQVVKGCNLSHGGLIQRKLATCYKMQARMSGDKLIISSTENLD